MPKKPSRPLRRRRILPKVQHCFFCLGQIVPDWKNPEVLRRFTSERGKILSADKTGICPKHQRKLSYTIKRARFLGLLPFTVGVK